jgi:murein DD-endopeptidase MepM/ murein hydrolase activator NlpD
MTIAVELSRSSTMKLVMSWAVAFALFSPPSDGYVLPYPKGVTCELLQGYAGAWGHEKHAEFSYDFQMAIGSPVVAARSGEVVHLVESHKDSTRKPGDENVLVIKHSDGTFARYYHLTTDGVLVALGDRISQGQRIALSGDSGASAGAHLHFDVTKACYEWGCQTLAISFDGVKENPLKQGERYEASK